MGQDVDILMITCNRPHYTRMSLAQLLRTCDENMRVWLWHNGQHKDTLELVKSFRNHPRVHRFTHSPENVGLASPTNWLWRESRATLVGKIDDDILVPNGWAEALRRAHHDVSAFGVLSCWNYDVSDCDSQRTRDKLRRHGSHDILQHPWVGGGSYLMKRDCVLGAGTLRPNETFPQYCVRLAWDGWVNGWLFPLILVDHMDDPRSPNTLLRSNADLARLSPLTARLNGAKTLDQWTTLIRIAAESVQRGRTTPGRCFGLRRRLYQLRGICPASAWLATDGPRWLRRIVRRLRHA